MLSRILVAVFSCAGLLISLYFTIVYYKPAAGIDRYVPSFCRIEPESCASLLGTRQARLYGMPNFVLGLLFYTGLVGSALSGILWKQLHLLLVLGSLVSVATGIYLTDVLIVRLKIHCTLCLASHAINLALCLILLTSP
ncbi:MAG TPA: vitamin K epoxide reductase family protein [Bacteroidota bacterium]